MTTHAQMRSILAEAFRVGFGRPGSTSELQCLQAVAKLETNYGDGWRGAGKGSNNIGAIQKGSWARETFVYTDTRPNADGTSTPYQTHFRKYPTLLDGAIDLVRVVYKIQRRDVLVLPPAKRGDLAGFSAGLYDSHYYEGWGRNRDERIAHHLKAVKDAVAKQAAALGEQMPDGTPAPQPGPRTLRLGMAGEDVVEMQAIIGAKPDGKFGDQTLKALIAWQVKHKLRPDGWWGPVCRMEADMQKSLKVFGLMGETDEIPTMRGDGDDRS